MELLISLLTIMAILPIFNTPTNPKQAQINETCSYLIHGVCYDDFKECNPLNDNTLECAWPDVVCYYTTINLIECFEYAN